MFKYEWNLSELDKVKSNDLKVFSCFSCGGGSSMGYKMAGYQLIGNCEFDTKVNDCYVKNLAPIHNYCEDVRDFKHRSDLPDELFELDILDGSPPCSAFSTAGLREEAWGKEKEYRKGLKHQRVDDLFFEFIEIADKLRPKVVVAENVKGLLHGDAFEYVQKIYDAFTEIGYKVTHKLLNAKDMGVPQSRERVFFIAVRDDIEVDTADLFSVEPSINLDFREKIIPIKSFYESVAKRAKQNYSEARFGDIILNVDKPSPTITLLSRYWTDTEHLISDKTLKLIGSYPLDYDFIDQPVQYLVGRSVPPIMMYRLSTEIAKQIFKKDI